MGGRVSGRRCALASAVLVLGGSALPAPPAAAETAPFAAAPQAREVTLVTGDRVTVFPGPNGGTNYALSSPPRTTFQSYQADGGDRYVIPSDAVPFLGKLDKSLFDVTALARTRPGNTPLEITFPAGAAPAALPGITLASAAGNTATGTLVSAAEFTADLHRRLAEDASAGRPAGSSALPATIRLAGAPREQQPRYPMKILELRLADLQGRSVNGMVSLINTDSSAKLLRHVDVDGVTRIAVPEGHYAASATFSDFDSSGSVTATRTSWVEGFVVGDSPDVQTLTVEEKYATAEVKVAAPKSATQDLLTTNFFREDPTGRGFAVGIAGGKTKQYVRPVPKPDQGLLHYVVQWGGKAPKPEDRYRVDLSFATEDISENQSFSTKDSELATVRDRMYADPADKMPVAIDSGPVDPVIRRHGLGASGFFIPAPGVLTDYLGTTHTREWVQYEQKGSSYQLMTADPHPYRPGSTTTVDWSRGPLSAGLGQWQRDRLCEACYSGGTVSVAIPALRDSVPDHTALPLFYAPRLHFSLYRDDQQVFDQDGAYGASVEVPKTPATFRGVLDVDRTAIPGVSQAGKLRTELTLRYDPAARTTLPTPHRCRASDPTQPCRILGALTVDYRLDSDLSTTSSSPVQMLELHVGHAAYSGAGSHSPITSATVSVSVDNGATWQPAQVFGLFGEYVAVWRNPPAGTSPSLKVTAQDLAGNAITQTISNAYTVGKAQR
ncbi:hypothetical protein [Amycolatopsis sp. La24]|uniref:hypothetical protein n=1 Tax=Amycolatopsis sp. La24 TaxID=3028304 RepID=UPI0023B07068|nr:hypothetical protein [Amycolatopsis sp. La24]